MVCMSKKSPFVLLIIGYSTNNKIHQSLKVHFKITNCAASKNMSHASSKIGVNNITVRECHNNSLRFISLGKRGFNILPPTISALVKFPTYLVLFFVILFICVTPASENASSSMAGLQIPILYVYFTSDTWNLKQDTCMKNCLDKLLT